LKFKDLVGLMQIKQYNIDYNKIIHNMQKM